MNVVLTSLAIILFTFAFPSKVDCCSDKATDIIDLIARDPEYKFHPCYIKWKAKEDAQIEKILKREEQEQVIKTSSPRSKTTEPTSYKKRKLKQQITFIRSPSNNETEKSNRQIYAGFVAAIVVAIIICASAGIGCCAAFIYYTKRKKWTADTTEDNGFTVLSTTPGLASNAWGNQTSDILPTTDLLSTPTAPEMDDEISSQINSRSLSQNSMVRENTRQYPVTNVPLVPKCLHRQNSLPSYDDVIKMPLTYAPPKG